MALKVLPSHALLDPKHLARFHRKAKAAARLHHTNIVPVYGVGETDGLHYYVMQFIQGQSLDQVLTELRHLRQIRHPASGKVTETGDVSQAAQGLLTGRFHAADAAGKAAPPSVHNDRESGTSVLPSSTIHLPGQSEQSSLSDSGREYWRSIARIGIQVAEALGYATN